MTAGEEGQTEERTWDLYLIRLQRVTDKKDHIGYEEFRRRITGRLPSISRTPEAELLAKARLIREKIERKRAAAEAARGEA